ncbi:MAG: hypothetical protein H7306_04355, partial [Bacteriovorax sp.]|nr:hypothetical protein [Rhizobacter sp.]
AELRGSLDDALRVFQRAADSTAELMARYPQDGQRVFDHAQSVYWVGYIARQRGQIPAAEASFRQYQALAQQLTRLDPNNLDWRIETAHAGVNLGVIYLEGSRPVPALDAFVDARDAWTGIAKVRPELGLELAKTWGWIAKAREAQGEFDAAADAQRVKVDVLGRLPGAGKNRDVQRLLANAAYELGRLKLVLGRPAPAGQNAFDACAQYEALVVADPANTDWLAQMNFARLSLAEIHLALGERAAARADLDRATTDMARLLSTDATRSKWNIALAGSLLLHRLALGEPPARSQPELEAFLVTVENAASRGKALDAEQARIASAVELALGDLQARAAQVGSAATHWQAVATRLQASSAAGEWPAMTLFAHARLRLGATDEARALAARIEASPYRHPAYVDLRQQLAAAAKAAPVNR